MGLVKQAFRAVREEHGFPVVDEKLEDMEPEVVKDTSLMPEKELEVANDLTVLGGQLRSIPRRWIGVQRGRHQREHER